MFDVLVGLHVHDIVWHVIDYRVGFVQCTFMSSSFQTWRVERVRDSSEASAVLLVRIGC